MESIHSFNIVGFILINFPKVIDTASSSRYLRNCGALKSWNQADATYSSS